MKQTLLTLLLVVLPVMASGYDVEIDGIYYEINTENETAKVTHGNWPVGYLSVESGYSGVIDIPESFNYRGTQYSVTSIGSYAFWNCSKPTTVSIPNTVTNIDYYAFKYSEGLTNVTFGDSVSIIGREAFQGCVNLTSIVLPNSVVTIEQSAFHGCSGLTSIIWGNSVTSIHRYAFSGCIGLMDINIPNSVTAIGEYAFKGCSSLKNVRIPSSVTNIGGSTFEDCVSIDTIYCYAPNVPNAYRNLFSIGSNNSIKLIVPFSAVSDYRGNKNWNVPDENVTSICKTIEVDGFCYNLILNDEGMNDAQVTVNPNGYEGNVEIKESITYDDCIYSVTSIGNSAFQGCKELLRISIPNSVNNIGVCAFQGCVSLTNIDIPNSVTSIGYAAFGGCSGLTKAIIPNSMNSIAASMFSGCKGLTNITLPSSVTTIGSSAFFGCSGLKSITLPNSVTSIGYSAFEGCSSLTSVIIGDSVTSIGDGAFKSCNCLTNVSLPNSVTSIGKSLFEDCSCLANVIFGDSMTSIGERMFYQCTGLVSIVIPNSVASIENEAFYCCSSLSNVALGNSVAYIGEKAFYSCRSLSDIPFVNSLKGIGADAFRGCSRLTSLTIPDSLINIGSNAFDGCYGLTSLVLGSSVATIGSGSFWGCRGLTSVTIPASVTSIGTSAFRDCTGLTEVNYNATMCSIKGDASLYPVFKGCNSLTTLKIGDNVKAIPQEAFFGCNHLISINIPETVTNIGKDAFWGCSNLTSVYISDLVAWCKIDFQSIAANPLSIAQHIFFNDEEIVDLIIPSSITTIRDYAFIGCTGLASVIIQNGVTAIGESAFQGCSGLFSVSLSDSLQIIKQKAFCWCSKLSTIAIPASVEYIYQEVFAYCDSLKRVKVESNTPPFLYDNSFSDYTIPLIVPKGTEETYSTAQGWNNFSIISDRKDYKLKYIVDNKDYIIKDVEIGTTIVPEAAPTKEGYTFSGWSEIPEAMPANDVTLTGTFSVNKYKLNYSVDGEEYKNYEVEYGTSITPETEPTKEGYTFSGWSEMPETMPANDVTITGTFSINKYKLVYMVDGVEYKSYDIEYGATITEEAEPTKEGHTFSGWESIPATMPANDVTVIGTFTIGAYKLTYMVDGEVYKTVSYDYDSTITPEAAPTKEGYTFSGWGEIPESMPAKDVNVNGTFTINTYKLTYMIDDKVHKVVEVEYGATIIPEPQPEGDYVTFAWIDLPQTMPANDIVVHASYTSGINSLLMARPQDVRIYSTGGKKQTKLKKGVNIIRMGNGKTQKVVVK